jgi:hypothetical protein
MNAVEIEEAVSKLAEAPFDPAEFPFAFLEAFGNKATTIKKLRSTAKSSTSNKSDLPGGVLQRNHIHIAVCASGEVGATLAALRNSPATASQKARFILATDGQDFQAENVIDGETVACDYADFHDHFGFFLALAGITTVKQIRENAFDIKATGRLNRLYVELLRENPDWDTAERREDLNHFFARLIFCFFAEDTGIFIGSGLFTDTLQQMTASDSSNTHEVLAELFRAMNTKPDEPGYKSLKNWAKSFPYVNGGLFSGSLDAPRFSRIARSYLLHVGGLDWTQINPDIFGSMIQAVADDEERGALGMHYTSVPNILKVLNPLFLDDLRAKLEEAGDNARKLLNLRNRMARIRVFDPACGSGNFLVIAYKHMREIEAEINRRRGDEGRHSEIPLTNFRGIEIRHFSAEIARLALIIAEYQCDVLYRGPVLARAEFLPLEQDNWITCGNALRLDWLKICPPTGTGVKVRGDDLFETPLDQAEIDFENEGGETYICGNPPYVGNKLQGGEQKGDLSSIFDGRVTNWRSLDYVTGWFMKAADFGARTKTVSAFVATNSICQGQQVPILWPAIFATGHRIVFGHTSFKWRNLASNNAGVTVVIVGIANELSHPKRLFSVSDDGENVVRDVSNINAYLAPASDLIVEPSPEAINGLAPMLFGNMPRDAGGLLLDVEERDAVIEDDPRAAMYLKDFVGSEDAIHGKRRVCIWVEADQYSDANAIDFLNQRFNAVRQARSEMKAASTQAYAGKPYRFVQIQGVARNHSFIVPRHSSESRQYLPIALFDERTIVADSASAVYDSPLHNFAILVSRLHLIWIASVCGKLETRYRYANTLGWNVYPVPPLTDQNKSDLTRCAEDILLAREAHFPATIADLYDPDLMPADLRAAHDRNDETLERIYIGRRFKNDTERLEKLFEMYTEMTAGQAAAKGTAKGPRKTVGRKKGAD